MNPEGYIQSIVEASKEERLLIVCGAGVSIASMGGNELAGWEGFIKHAVDWCRSNGVALQGRSALERACADVDAGDFLSAADKIHRGLRSSNQWARFISDTFKKFKAVNRELINAISALEAPIITTNYDTLIEMALGVASVSWKSDLFTQCIRDRSIGIGHVHGVWTEPDSIIFGTGSYGRLSAVESVQALERAIALRSVLLFVGVGAGINDPNLGELISYLEVNFRDKGLIHFQLLSQKDAQALRHDSVIKPLIYGSNHSTELVPFIKSLVVRCGKVAVSSKSRHCMTGIDLLAVPLLAAFGEHGPTLGHIWPDLLIDIHVRSVRDLNQEVIPLSEWICKRNLPERLAVIGTPGAGKSTTLRRLALSEETTGRKCEFFSAHSLANAGHIEDTGTVVLVIDGIDELGDAKMEYLSRLLSTMHSRPIWLSCRSDFFFRESPAKTLLESMDQVLEVQPLSETDINNFIFDYVQRTNCSEAAKKIDLWRQSHAFYVLLRTPINLILALFLASGNRLGDLSDDPPTTRFQLYDMFYRHWLIYESKRAKIPVKERPWVFKDHVNLATKIYRQRQGFRLAIRRSMDVPANSKEFVANSFLVVSEERSGTVFRFRHDTYMEYLLAADLIEKLRCRTRGRPKIDIAFNDDVNAFVREGISQLSVEEREHFLDRLKGVYMESISPREREHALYYIGRLALPECPQILVTAFEDEKYDLARRAAALGAILHGNTEIETAFIEELENSERFAIVNRSVQLIYFGDARGDLHSYLDSGGSWKRTRQALFSRLNDKDERALSLRWWDLQTIASLFFDRKASLTPPERATLEAVHAFHSTKLTRRDAAITTTINRLLSAQL